ncbi:4-(cytidine 5'-diphospho)-2-C-methyl-D-erythritol kinase [Calorimonas adulescens]|uniref:4-diphosphocytidyl-2-C-methyl-D-erythritol kinase n=1 Tax=Calorimonas adulescens TaxID=2606906 RepID=A0A5D8QED5_9THEO|nr:4-(cytidine 5'-diphospho)-2-C-methyl-D-erythritol kinase [Calorimonas adulescens]TZE82871.1 4-(cytidine 5'-diphospho)-2-C-methyl-D-erythritol kinase [Calorimonas adulescens]
MFLRANAKINLFLDVIGTRDDGYHDIVTVMHTIGLHDTVYIKPIFKKINVDMLDMPKELNLAYKAACALRGKRDNLGAYIKIRKRIPIGSGMGGGSSDAAQVLIGLNKLWRLNKTDEELMEIAASIGSDVPFFIKGGMALAEGRGERITPLDPIDLDVLIVKPKESISTRKIYSILDNVSYSHGDIDGFLENCHTGDPVKIARYMDNVLEAAAHSILPSIEKIKRDLEENGAVKAMMTGGGSAVFGVFTDRTVLMNAYKKLKLNYPFVYYTKTVGWDMNG